MIDSISLLTVRQKTGRKRYIAARIAPAPHSKGEFLHALKQRLEQETQHSSSMRLLLLNHDLAIIACSHGELSRIAAALNGSIGRYTSRTLLVSGTIRTLKERFGIS